MTDDRYCYRALLLMSSWVSPPSSSIKNWDFSAAFHASIGNYVYYDFLNNKANLSQNLTITVSSETQLQKPSILALRVQQIIPTIPE